MPGDLSTNFSRHEFACHGKNCCGGSAPVDSRLIAALQEFRAKIGEPVHINSGFRCLTHNRNIGSKDTSQHTHGYASDLRLVPGKTIAEMAEIAESIESFRNGGIGLYDGFIHVDVRPDGPARWDMRSPG